MLPLVYHAHDWDYLAVDPTDGAIIKVLEKYQVITAPGHFVRWSNRTHQAWWLKGRPLAPDYQ